MTPSQNQDDVILPPYNGLIVKSGSQIVSYGPHNDNAPIGPCFLASGLGGSAAAHGASSRQVSEATDTSHSQQHDVHSPGRATFCAPQRIYKAELQKHGSN